LGIDLAPLWGVLVFFLAYIPNIGIGLASIPPVFLAFILHGWQTALLTIALIILLNFIMDNIFTPKFMGITLKLPTIIVFLSFMFWTWIFGPLGAFISLPLTLAIRGLLASSPQTAFIAQILTSEDNSH
jgi:predicted PurR-regulated permease PerM